MIKIYIIDDHPLMVMGLKDLIRHGTDDLCVAGSAQDIESALDGIITTKPDIIILDLFLQKDDPMDNYKRLKEAFPKTPIVILTSEESLLWQVRMYKEGASGYIIKDQEPREIKSLLRSLATGKTPVFPFMTDISIEEKDMIQFLSDDFFGLEMVYELANGATPKEIALKHGKSLSLIEKNLQTMRCVYNARSNSELINILVRKRIL